MSYDPPTEIIFHKNSFIDCMTWMNENNESHRENDLPAYITFYENGYIETLFYLINNESHRENDLPAFIHFHEDGSIYQKIWCNKESYHRLYGPAQINNNYEYWYINGEHITDEVIDFIKEYDLPHYSKWTDNHKMLFKLRFC